MGKLKGQRMSNRSRNKIKMVSRTEVQTGISPLGVTKGVSRLMQVVRVSCTLVAALVVITA
jgi:hypothetical protein